MRGTGSAGPLREPPWGAGPGRGRGGQATQNRDTEAIQIKLDELIRATKGAHNALLDLEEMDDEMLNEFRARYEKLAESARKGVEEGTSDTDSPEP